MVRLQFLVTVVIERTSGKFASKDDLREAITEWLENANEGTVEGVGTYSDSEYEVTDWQVESA